MANVLTTGTVCALNVKLKSFSIQPPGGPPAPPPVAFTDPTPDEWAVIVAAWGGGKSITVDSGLPPLAPPNIDNVIFP